MLNEAMIKDWNAINEECERENYKEMAWDVFFTRAHNTDADNRLAGNLAVVSILVGNES